MYATPGAWDVAPALPDIQRHRARKSVLSGTGYEDGQRVTVSVHERDAFGGTEETALINRLIGASNSERSS